MNEQETYNRGLDEQPAAASQPPAAPAGGGSPTRLPDEPYYQQAPAARPRNRGVGMALVVVGVIWLLSIVLGGGLFGSGPSDKLIDETLPGSRLEMNVGSGDVEIRPWRGQGIHVQAFRRGGSEGDHTVEVRTSGDTVQVNGVDHSFFCFFCSRDVNYEVSVPADIQVDIHTSSGDISIEELNGPVSLGTVSGDMRVRNIEGGATISTTSGEVQIDGIGGDVDITTVSGNVRLADGNNVQAAVRTTSGDIELDGVANVLTLGSVSGEIEVNNARDGQITAETTSGDFTYSGSLASEGRNRISTISGDVNLNLPEDSNFQLNASTVSGDLSSDFELRDGEESRRSRTGRAGSGSAALEIETTSGDVTLRSD